MIETLTNFINKIKNKFNDPNKLCFVFYGATALVILSRLFSFLFNMRKLTPMPGWASWEYTIAFLLPLAGFAYFINSKYAEDHSKKMTFYVITYACIAGIVTFMLAEWANAAFWFILNLCFGENSINLAKAVIGIRLRTAVQAFSLYVPISCITPTIGMILPALKDPDASGQIKDLVIIDNTKKMMDTGVFTCEVKVCDDAVTGKPIIIPENRRMEATFIQGATGTGKTSTLLLPMCASDLEKKFFLKEHAKEVAYEALKKGLAYVCVPCSNEYLNKYFSLSYIQPFKDKIDEYREVIKDHIRYYDPETNQIIYKDLGITVVEPDGKYMTDFQKVAKNFNIDVAVIDPMDPNSYGINPFVIERPTEVASIIATVLKGMYEAENPSSNNVFFGQVTQQALENLSILLKVMYPRLNAGELPTLEDMLALLYDYNMVETMCEELKKDPELAEEHKILIKYFEKNFYAPNCDINGRPIPGTLGSGRRDTEKFLYGAMTQLDNLMRHEAVKNILCNRYNNLDFKKVLAEGQCVAVCTRRGELGSLLAKPFGMFYILTMQEAVLARPGNEKSRIPHFLYIDEFPDFVNSETETCFTLFRKYRCAMTIAIQNLAQLERTEDMKYYRQVVISNTKTQLVFGDTNVEDSEYWSDAFGKREYQKLSNSLSVTPLGNVKEGDSSVQNEGYGMKISFTEQIKAFKLNNLPFRTLMYRTRDETGVQKLAQGKTNFLDKKYWEPHEGTNYNFEKYIMHVQPQYNANYEHNYDNSIISEELIMDDILKGRVN